MDLQALIADIKTNNIWVHDIINPVVVEDYGTVNDIHSVKKSAVIFYKDANDVLQPSGRVEFLIETDTSVTPEVETASLIQETLDRYNPNITPPLSFVDKLQQARDQLLAVKQVFGVKRIDLDNIGEVAVVEAIHPHPDNILLPNADQKKPNTYIKYRVALDAQDNVMFWPESDTDLNNRTTWVNDMVAAGIDPNNPAASWGAGEQP